MGQYLSPSAAVSKTGCLPYAVGQIHKPVAEAAEVMPGVLGSGTVQVVLRGSRPGLAREYPEGFYLAALGDALRVNSGLVVR